MASIHRIRINWTGFPGGPGISNLYYRDPDNDLVPDTDIDAAITTVEAFINNTQGVIPNTVSRQIDPVVDVFNDVTGDLLDSSSHVVEAAVPGTASGSAYISPAGACIGWTTNGIRRSRRVRGRTFLVPLAGGMYDSTGTLLDSAVTTIQTQANALISQFNNANLRLHIWSRPSSPGADDGESHEVFQARVRDKVAILRSRRD